MRKESKYHKTLVDLAEVLLEENNTLSVKVSGISMFPSLKDGENCFLEKCRIKELKIGDIIACRRGNFLIVHRLKRIKKQDGRYILEMRGDNVLHYDPPFTEDQFVAKLLYFKRNDKIHQVDSLSMKVKKFIDDYFHPLSCRISRGWLFLNRGFSIFRDSYKSINFNIRQILRSSNKLFRINALISIMQGLIPLAIIVCVKLLVDFLTGNSLHSTDRQVIWFVLLGVTGLFFLSSSVLNQLYGYFTEKMSQSVTRQVYADLHEKHTRLGLSVYENPEKQDKMHRAVQEASFRPVKILTALLTFIRTISSGVVLIGLFISIRWYLILILLVAVIPDAVIRLKYSRKRYHLKDAQTTRERAKYYYNRVLTAFPFAKELRLFGFSDFFQRRYNRTQDELFDEKITLSRTELRFTVAAQAFAVALIFGSLGIVSYLTMQGALTVGAVVLFFFAFQRGYSTLNDFFRSLTGLMEDNTFLQDLIDFLKIPDNKSTSVADKPFTLEHEIRFDRVSFRYENSNRNALKDVTLRIPVGKTVALVGENGSGKTTLVKLLCGFYEPDAGTILIDGVDARRIGQQAVCENSAAVFQDFALYQVSAMQNILLGDVNKEADPDKARLAAAAAGIDATLENLPRGYQTLLGTLFDGSEELSIGQWQKMAIARAFYRDAPLLLMDEPSSALDAVSESQLIARLKELSRNKTSLIISHRLSTVQWADCIYLLDKGEVAEQGTHAELMALKGKYYTLVSGGREYEVIGY